MLDNGPVLLAVFVTICGIIFCGWLWQNLVSPGGVNAPILSASQIFAEGAIEPFHKGEIQGFQYNVLAGGNGRVLIFVQLHHNTFLHIVAVGDKTGLSSRISRPRLKKSLTKLDLEGDYPSYFSMYCTPGKEQELLQLFDPADMAYFVDFCRAYDFELFHDTIYISQAQGARDPDDTTVLIHDIQAFLKRNYRLLQRLEADYIARVRTV